MTDHVPPQNKEAEEAVLSAIMTFERDPGQISFLEPCDFYFEKHRIIFDAVKSLCAKHEPIDSVSVAQRLGDSGKLDTAGGISYIASIIDSAPVAVNFRHYAQIVKDCAIQRQVILAAQSIVTEGLIKNMPAEELLSLAQSTMLNIKTTCTDDAIQGSIPYVNDGINYIESLSKGMNPNRLKTGFKTFDSICNIMGPLLILIAARPGVGKTSLALSMMRNMLKMDHKIGFLSLEMSKEQIFLRHLAIETGINISRFSVQDGEQGCLGEDEWESVLKMSEKISKMPFLIDDSSARIEDVERKCRIMKEQGVKGIFIDQLSKIKGGTGGLYEIFTKRVNRLSDLKKELDIPIFLLAQINRGVVDNADKMPNMAQLKQSGALEEDADMIFFINRPGHYDENIDKSIAEVHLGKHRNGSPWWHKDIHFNQKTTYYSEIIKNGY